jgi:alanine dehydrogenase
VIVLSQQQVQELLDLDALIDALADAHRELSEGKASMPARIAAFAERGGLLGAMPSYLPSAGLACKLVTLFPQNTDRHTHQALIGVFDPDNGTPIALMDGTYITATRTAAGSALATRLLAREDAKVLAILGAGVQARTHADALRRVRDFEEIRVASRNPERAAATAQEIGATAAESFEQAVRGADVVAATTHATEPIVLRDWLEPGTHVNSVGANPDGTGEVDPAIVREAAVVAVEYRGSTLAPPPAGAAEFREGAPKVVELGELVAGTRPGRSAQDEVTLYKSVGVAVQDAAAAALVLAAARERAVGQEIDLEEAR